jgi:hypothetical protein
VCCQAHLKLSGGSASVEGVRRFLHGSCCPSGLLGEEWWAGVVLAACLWIGSSCCTIGSRVAAFRCGLLHLVMPSHTRTRTSATATHASCTCYRRSLVQQLGKGCAGADGQDSTHEQHATGLNCSSMRL